MARALCGRRSCGRSAVALFLLLIIFSSVSVASVPVPTRAPDIRGSVWFNAASFQPARMKDLQGRVVLVFFWAPDEPACRQAIEYVSYWYSLHRRKGLVAIGVLSPELALDESHSAVSRKIEKLGIAFPVALDDESATKRNYEVDRWPSLFLVDRFGFVRAQYAGELRYDRIETMLETLLEERGPVKDEEE